MQKRQGYDLYGAEGVEAFADDGFPFASHRQRGARAQEDVYEFDAEEIMEMFLHSMQFNSKKAKKGKRNQNQNVDFFAGLGGFGNGVYMEYVFDENGMRMASSGKRRRKSGGGKKRAKAPRKG